MILSAESIAFSLDKGKCIRPGEYQACCPAHSDTSPSLRLTQKGDTVLWHCFSGCSQMEVRDALCLKGLLPKPRVKESVSALSTYDKVEMWVFICAHESNLKKNIPTSKSEQKLYRQYQRVVCSPFSPKELVEAHLFCLTYSATVKKGETPSDDEDDTFRLCSYIHCAVGGYVPYEY